MDSAQKDWRDLATKGYCVARGFLSAEELQRLQVDYRSPVSAAGDEANKNYNLKVVAADIVTSLDEKLKSCADAIAAQTGITADITVDAVYFATERGIDFSWHQDHEPLFLLQQTYHYLNFYIPVIKPDRQRSNLCVIPFDALLARAPELRERFIGAGAQRMFIRESVTAVFDDEHDSRYVLRFDLEELAVTPQLEAGDLLLLRGDMIHRTQDAATERVSVSIRRQCSQTLVSRSRIAEASPAKKSMIEANPMPHQRILRCFDESGCDYLPAGDIVRFLRSTSSRGCL